MSIVQEYFNGYFDCRLCEITGRKTNGSGSFLLKHRARVRPTADYNVFFIEILIFLNCKNLL